MNHSKQNKSCKMGWQMAVFQIFFAIFVLLVATSAHAEDSDKKPKNCQARCQENKKQCASFCQESYDSDASVEKCQSECDFVFDQYCSDSCKSDQNFNFSCQADDYTDDVDFCQSACESHYAILALNCYDKFKDDKNAKQNCFNKASALVDDTKFCYQLCKVDAGFACEPKQ